MYFDDNNRLVIVGMGDPIKHDLIFPFASNHVTTTANGKSPRLYEYERVLANKMILRIYHLPWVLSSEPPDPFSPNNPVPKLSSESIREYLEGAAGIDLAMKGSLVHYNPTTAKLLLILSRHDMQLADGTFSPNIERSERQIAVRLEIYQLPTGKSIQLQKFSDHNEIRKAVVQLVTEKQAKVTHFSSVLVRGGKRTQISDSKLKYTFDFDQVFFINEKTISLNYTLMLDEEISGELKTKDGDYNLISRKHKPDKEADQLIFIKATNRNLYFFGE